MLSADNLRKQLEPRSSPTKCIQKIQTEWQTVKTLTKLDLGIHCCRDFESLKFKDGGSTIEHANANGTVLPAKSDNGVMLSGT